MSTKFRVFVTLLLISSGISVARAQHGHDAKKGEEHGKPVAFTMPTTYRLAVREVGHRLHEISELIEAKQLDKIHAEAEVIQKVAKQVGQLALKEGSGVPKEAVKDVNAAGKDLAAKFDAIDKAGDSGDLAGTRKIHDDMAKIAATLQKYAAPSTYGEAVDEIEHHLQEIGELIEAKKLEHVQEHADDLQETAKIVGQLASKDGSGVPKEAVKDVTRAADAVAEKSEAIEKVGGSGDLAGAKRAYEELVRVNATLQKFVAAVYQCPMKCEGEKTYDKPGKCPKCGMELKARK